MILHDHLAQKPDSVSSEYSSLSTERLLALSDSKFRDLVKDQWTGANGLQALNALIELSGVRTSTANLASIEAATSLSLRKDASNDEEVKVRFALSAFRYSTYDRL